MNPYHVTVSGWAALGVRGMLGRGSSFRCKATSPGHAAKLAAERFFMRHPDYDEACLIVRAPDTHLDFEASRVGHDVVIWTHRGEA